MKHVGMQCWSGIIVVVTFYLNRSSMAEVTSSLPVNVTDKLSLDQVRDTLIRMEDTIIFSLIERAKYPLNSPLYDQKHVLVPAYHGSLFQYFVQETEFIQAKSGRYENPEENPFFPHYLPQPVVPASHYPKILHPAAANINRNKELWNLYIHKLLPLFVSPGHDGNYAATAASDLDCLQALSRRIHYGKFVAEVKFRDAPLDYEPAIRAENTTKLMKLLTFETVEEQVKRRVIKKATIFGQEVTLDDNARANSKYKVDPSFVGQLYQDCVIPLTKNVEVDYLLKRLT